MRKVGFAVLAGAAALLGVVGSAAAGPPKPKPPNNVVGHVYVNDNTAGVNSVAAFDRHADGSLTPTPGSPFSVGGAGLGKGDASQGSLELSSDRRYLLAVDAGSNQISVLRIGHDGSLDPVPGSPFESGGVNPVSIAVSRDLVYVANQGTKTLPSDNYTGFRLHPDGRLDPIPGSTVTLPDASLPADVLFNSDGRKLVGTEVGSSKIDSFTVGRNGLLTAAKGSPFDAQTSFTPAQGFGQLGSEFSPTKPDQLFVSDAHDSTGAGAPGLVSSFRDDPHGVLAPIGSSPVGNPGKASCWVEISHDGRYLFVVNTGSSTVSTYSIAHDGSISWLQDTPSGELGGGAEDARLSPDGSTLWVVQAGADAVTGFSVSGGALTPLSQASGPAGATPTGIVVT
jgi:6-phosphogluconolactonase (cycloisomerase 2 family)